jgi:hypothetical protein
MKRIRCAVLAATLFSGSGIAFASPQTVEGVISDTMCGKQHMLPGKTDARCIKECIGGKTQYVARRRRQSVRTVETGKRLREVPGQDGSRQRGVREGHDRGPFLE